MASVASAAAMPASDEIQMERNAGLIMGTNNSSIVSKRSVERLYLPEPHFYRYFVRKPQRRSPTINRGYWLRMRVVDWTVRQFLERQSDRPKIVINLGCGYDPLPFQWLSTERDLCQNTKFIDVDYEELMVSKTTIIHGTSKLQDLVSDVNSPISEKSVLLNSNHYAALGCDLRNTKRLQRLLNLVCDVEKCLVLCVAEVSITYMHTDAADALIAWTSNLSNDVTFCLLEQGSPDRPDNPFTATMVKHFQKLGTPLHSLFEYPGIHTQTVRFQRAGYPHCEVQNLWELWSNPRFLSISQRLALNQVEPFDEWEEFALFASHYLLVVADNRPSLMETERPRSRRDSIASIASDISARTASPFKQDHQWFAMKFCEDKSEETKRHHASSYQLYDQDAIAMHGGIGPRARLSTTAVCRDRTNDESPPVVPPPDVGARCCHTVTTLTNGQNMLIGGRGSPSQPMKDCWVQTRSRWTRVHDLPVPRYRHRSVPVTLPNGCFGVIVFGGKSGHSKVVAETLLWHPRTGWENLVMVSQTPMPRFGATFVHLGFNHGLLFGGMREDGIICQGLWRWRLIIRDNKVAGLSFRTSNALDASIGAYPWFSRFGASYGLVRDELLIIGGIAKSGCVPKTYEIMSILGSFSAFNEYEKEMQLRLTCVEPTMVQDGPRPFFIGHSTHRTKTGTLIFMGGGATCFSFGNYYNTGIWVMYEREAGLHINWAVVPHQTTQAEGIPHQKEIQKVVRAPLCADIPSAMISKASEFVSLIQTSRPAVLKQLDLGPCLAIWDPEYLRRKVAKDKTVVIHSSSSPSMNFQRKDFAYKTLPFDSFIAALNSSSSHIYLRALSANNPTTTPANFDIDWPELSSDVVIPTSINGILQKTKHSSCLRIANKTTMWLHYDVMANVLFQIYGRKKLVLFAPTDIKYLSIPPGCTTSTIDIFDHDSKSAKPKNGALQGAEQRESNNTTANPDNTDLDPSITVPQGTTPYVVTLNQGDALFIPPLWAHTGISLVHDNKMGRYDQTNKFSADTKTSTAQVAGPAEDNAEDLFSSSVAAAAKTPETRSQEQRNRYTNIALNVFFRSLPKSAYATGRDIYGNRDLLAYEDSRRDLERIVKRFIDLGEPRTGINGIKRATNKKSTDVEKREGSVIYTTRAEGEDELEAANTNKSGAENKNNGDILNADLDIDVDAGVDFDTEMETTIPRDIRKAYLQRLADELSRKADEL